MEYHDKVIDIVEHDKEQMYYNIIFNGKSFYYKDRISFFQHLVLNYGIEVDFSKMTINYVDPDNIVIEYIERSNNYLPSDRETNDIEHSYYNENINKLSMKDFKLMKNTAYLINTARGKIIKEDDLIQAVKNKLIAGAVLDVIKNEPPVGDEAILHCENIVVTPHISYISEESFKDLKLKTLKNLIDMLNDKKPVDLVNK